MVHEEIIEPHILPVYITYTRLTSTSLGYLLSSWGQIADHISENYADINGIKYTIFPTLEIESVHTGDSIKFIFGEGWIPTITSDKNNDIVINIPKKIGIPLLIGYLMLSVASNTLDVYNKYLDLKLKQIELQLKKTEIRKIIEKKPFIVKELNHHALKIYNSIIENKDFKTFLIYDIDIKNIIKEKSEE